VTVALAACASTGSAGDGPASPAAGAGATASSRPTAAVTDYLAYIGGTAGKADPSKSPVSIGWINTQGGAVSYPNKTAAAEAAVRYTNAELGGIGGHPLQLRTCFIAQAEEEGQRCGQQLMNDDSVAAIVYGAVVFGNDSLNSVIAGQKPRIIDVALDANSTAANTYILFGDASHVYGPYGTFARDVLHARTAAVVHGDEPGENAGAAAVKKALQDAGITVTSVAYSPTATDLLGPLTAAGAQKADVIIPVATPSGCTGVAKALQQIGSTTPVVSTPLCLDPSVASALGGDLPKGWIFGMLQTLPTDPHAPDAVAYTAAATRNGLSAAQAADPLAALAWSETFTAIKALNTVGPDKLTPADVSADLKAFTGPVPMGPPTLECGAIADATAVCNEQGRFYRYAGAGAFTPLSDWLRPPAG
jgi:branched-chain amino acid transport system substrate-binding protein